MSRPKLTLGFRYASQDERVESNACDDPYVEASVDDQPSASESHAAADNELDHDGFRKRMENWRKTVRLGLGGGSGGYCASWAKWYFATKHLHSTGPKEFEEMQREMRVPVSIDELDGWLVEAAVRSLINFNERKVLQWFYVHNYPEHWIKSKLALRKASVLLIKARAEKNLQILLARLENSTYIYKHQFNAGSDPRLETKVVQVGAALSLEKLKALNDSSFGAFCISRSDQSANTFENFPSIFAGENHEEITEK